MQAVNVRKEVKLRIRSLYDPYVLQHNLSMNLTYKEEHEMFVSGHEGTTIAEVSVVSLVAPTSVILRNCMRNWILGTKSTLPIWLVFV